MIYHSMGFRRLGFPVYMCTRFYHGGFTGHSSIKHMELFALACFKTFLIFKGEYITKSSFFKSP